MTDRLRIGILGTANIARGALIPAIRASRNAEAVAVASRTEERARVFGAEVGVTRVHGSYEALLNDRNVDAVYNALPNSLHASWSNRAARAGKHVLCEKPLGRTAEECREMFQVAEDHGVTLMEAFMYRFHPRTEKMLSLVRSGVIGDVRLIRSSFTFRLTKPGNIRTSAALGGGALLDVGVYCVDVSRRIAAGRAIEAQAFANFDPAPDGVDKMLVGSVLFENGVAAQFDCALSIERREHLEIVGTLGSLSTVPAFLPGTSDVEILERHGRADPIVHRVGGVDQYRLMVEHFVDVVRGQASPQFSPEETIETLAIIDALHASARDRGRPHAVERSS